MKAFIKILALLTATSLFCSCITIPGDSKAEEAAPAEPAPKAPAAKAE